MKNFFTFLLVALSLSGNVFAQSHGGGGNTYDTDLQLLIKDSGLNFSIPHDRVGAELLIDALKAYLILAQSKDAKANEIANSLKKGFSEIKSVYGNHSIFHSEIIRPQIERTLLVNKSDIEILTLNWDKQTSTNKMLLSIHAVLNEDDGSYNMTLTASSFIHME